MKKNYIMLIVLLLFIGVTSCEKDETNVIESKVEVSCSEALSDGKYLKEIVVTDETGKNQAFYAIYSNDETLLNQFYESHNFLITIEKHDIKSMKPRSETLNLKESKSDFNERDYPGLNSSEPDINIILINYNIEEGTASFSLSIESNYVKNDYPVNTSITYQTTEDFIGVVHRCHGHDFIIEMIYKNCWLCFEKNYLQDGYLKYWKIYPNPNHYYSDYLDISTWRRAIRVYRHINQSSINYEIVYSVNNFRGQECLLGTYDNNNYGECYVATAPVGSTPFIWGPNPNDLRFYYHALNGNQCPLAGSWFDGYSCFVVAIPTGAEPYLWNRNMLVRSQRLL
jgi:hypothetical protein